MVDTSPLSSFGQVPHMYTSPKNFSPEPSASRLSTLSDHLGSLPAGGTGILGTWPSICGEAISLATSIRVLRLSIRTNQLDWLNLVPVLRNIMVFPHGPFTLSTLTLQGIAVIILDWVSSGAPWWSHSLIDWMEWIRGRGAPRALNLT
jgi:hypothetical protein